jgi:hypothetical protein
LKPYRCLALCMLLAMFGVASIQPRAEGEDQAQNQGLVFHWTGKLSAGQMLEIKNANGNIDAEGIAGNEIQVTAEKSGQHADQVKIEVVPSVEGVTICAIYPPGIFGGSASHCEPNKGYSSNVNGDEARVHFTVRLPKNLRFSGVNVNGNVRADDMGRFVHAVSVNGSVGVSTEEWAQAETVNGSIKVTMGDADWPGKLKIASVNGSVELHMPSDLNADVKFSSVNGEMSSDFPIEISNGWPVGHSAHGTVGKGGRSLVVDTVNGSVSMQKSAGTL